MTTNKYHHKESKSEIQAVRWNGQDNVEEVKAFLNPNPATAVAASDHVVTNPSLVEYRSGNAVTNLNGDDEELSIGTPEGPVNVRPGSWVVHDNGRLFAVDHDTFQGTYNKGAKTETKSKNKDAKTKDTKNTKATDPKLNPHKTSEDNNAFVPDWDGNKDKPQNRSRQNGPFGTMNAAHDPNKGKWK